MSLRVKRQEKQEAEVVLVRVNKKRIVKGKRFILALDRLSRV